jgi:hypothetical protein
MAHRGSTREGATSSGYAKDEDMDVEAAPEKVVDSVRPSASTVIIHSIWVPVPIWVPMPAAGATTGGQRHDRRQPTGAGGLSRRRSKAGAMTSPGGRRGGGRSWEGSRLGRRG